MLIQTVDLVDQFQPLLQGCVTQFRQFGKRKRASGPVRTIKTYEDNGLVEDAVSSPGNGAILVVDGGGSLRTALLGDILAGRAMQNGWAGIILFGAVRDIEALDALDFHVKALGVNPWVSVKQRAGSVDAPIMFGEARFDPHASHVYSDEDGILISNGPLPLG